MKKASDFIIPDFVFYIYINRLGFIYILNFTLLPDI